MRETFKAKYDGVCSECGDTIRKGDELEFVEDHQAVHAACTPEAQLAGNRVRGREHLIQRETCPKCWTVKAANGACACEPEHRPVSLGDVLDARAPVPPQRRVSPLPNPVKRS